MHLVALKAIALPARAHASAGCHHLAHAAKCCLLFRSLISNVDDCEDLFDVEDLAEVVLGVLDIARIIDDLLFNAALLLQVLGGLAASAIITTQGLILLLPAATCGEDVLLLLRRLVLVVAR